MFRRIQQRKLGILRRAQGLLDVTVPGDTRIVYDEGVSELRRVMRRSSAERSEAIFFEGGSHDAEKCE